MNGIFITGTDTGVGKTYFTSLLTRALRKRSVPAIPLKPISAGDRTDSIILSEATGGEISPVEINPVHFPAPLSPYAASMVEGRPFPWGILRERMVKLAQNYHGPFLVEGVGGWRVPLDSRGTTQLAELLPQLASPAPLVRKRGELMSLMVTDQFNALLTFDKNLQYQQNFNKYSLPVLVLNADDNSYLTLVKLIPQIKEILSKELTSGPIEIK
jgi:dethiobiotin synthase